MPAQSSNPIVDSFSFLRRLHYRVWHNMIIFEHPSTGCCYDLLFCSMYYQIKTTQESYLFPGKNLLPFSFMTILFLVFNQYSDRSTCMHLWSRIEIEIKPPILLKCEVLRFLIIKEGRTRSYWFGKVRILWEGHKIWDNPPPSSKKKQVIVSNFCGLRISEH